MDDTRTLLAHTRCMDMMAHISLRSIPKYKSSVGLAWDTANDKVKSDMVNLFQTDQGPAGTYYRSCMDLDKIDKEAGKPMDPWLAVIDKVDDMPSLVKAVVEMNKVDMDTLFSWYIDRCVFHVNLLYSVLSITMCILPCCELHVCVCVYVWLCVHREADV
jgi:predicted metalloendopeptidase